MTRAQVEKLTVTDESGWMTDARKKEYNKIMLKKKKESKTEQQKKTK